MYIFYFLKILNFAMNIRNYSGKFEKDDEKYEFVSTVNNEPILRKKKCDFLGDKRTFLAD